MSYATGSERRVAAGLTVLRLAVGLTFLAHGAQKLFVFGHAGVTGAFAGMGIPFPGVTGALVTAVEFLGGLALVLGLLTRLAALPLILNMLGAIAFVHLKNGFFLPSGFEYAFALLAGSAALALAGPGALALDNVLFRGRREQAQVRAGSGKRERAELAA